MEVGGITTLCNGGMIFVAGESVLWRKSWIKCLQCVIYGAIVAVERGACCLACIMALAESV